MADPQDRSGAHAEGPQQRNVPAALPVLIADVLMALAAALAVSALSLHYGFQHPPVSEGLLRLLEWLVLGMFLGDRLIRLAGCSDRRQFLRENWFDFALLAAAAAAMAIFGEELRYKILAVANVYVVITQFYQLVGLVVAAAKRSGLLESPRPAQVIVLLAGAFTATILFGTGLLMLPKATLAAPLSFSDALFTATSALTLTGLATRNLANQFSIFGQLVVLLLFQLGGLGVMIFGCMLAWLAGWRPGLAKAEPDPSGQARPSAQKPWTFGRVVKVVALATLALELVGSAACYPMWQKYEQQLAQPPASGDGYVSSLAGHEPAWQTTVFRSLFHSVSAFCNAGFTLQGDGLEGVRHYWQVLGVLGTLIFAGGLGVPVLLELALLLLARFRLPDERRPELSTYSKIVLTSSVLLVVLGGVGLIWIEQASYPGPTFGAAYVEEDNPYKAEPGKALADLPPLDQQVREGMFQAISARGGGMSTLALNKFSEGGKGWLCLLMLIGGSPAGTAGGMRTVVFALLLLAAWRTLRRQQSISAFARELPPQGVRSALAVAAAFAVLVFVVTILLCATMTEARRLTITGQPATFMQLFYEAASACSNSGFSCGVTPNLTLPGKFAVMAGMLLGRVGPMALFALLLVKPHPPEEPLPPADLILA